MKEVKFERAIFLSWYCSKADCKFCYMSTQKDKIKDPFRARRTKESILAEVLICKVFNWGIEFLSGGYESYRFKELINLIKDIKKIYGKKLWLNIGVLNEDELRALRPYTEGICGAVECVNKEIHDFVCPSKPIEEIEKMFLECGKLKLKKAITIILGLGETLKDFKALKKFIDKYKINKIIFYRLKPQKGTIFENAKPITKEYYAKWVSLTRKYFRDITINVGSWLGYLDEISLLIKSGANNITKFPSIKMFGSEFARKIEQECNKYSVFKSNLTRMVEVNWEEEVEKLNLDEKLKEKILVKLNKYIAQMKKNLS